MLKFGDDIHGDKHEGNFGRKNKSHDVVLPDKVQFHSHHSY